MIIKTTLTQIAPNATEIESLALPLVTLLSQPGAPGKDGSAVAGLTPDDIGAAAKQDGQILGQSDVRTDLTATNGATVTLNYALGNAFAVDSSGMGAGEAFTVAISTFPAGAVFAALSLVLITGANLPTVTWPTGVSAPTLEASKRNRFTLSTWDNGTTVDLDTLGAL